MYTGSTFMFKGLYMHGSLYMHGRGLCKKLLLVFIFREWARNSMGGRLMF